MTHQRILLAATVAMLALIGAPAVHAVTIFSQTPASDITATASDLNFDVDGIRHADDFVLGAAATARSVTWRGVFAGFDETPNFPLSFDLTIYNDDGGVPGLPGTVLSSTPVTFNMLGDITDTGVDLSGISVYEFQADLTPTALLAGTTYWFSTQADTSNDAADNWFWTSGGTSFSGAVQNNVTGNGPWESINLFPFYFILDDEPIGGAAGNAVPEPISAALGLMGLATLAVATRRRVNQ